MCPNKQKFLNLRYLYFLSLQNLLELFTFSLSLSSLMHTDLIMRSELASVAVLFSFMLFPLYIEKMSMIGIYVVAFKRTLINSAKFFPIFAIFLAGFILSFNIRSNFGVVFFKSGITSSPNDTGIAGYSLLRTLTLATGEFETDKMGMDTDFFLNYFIYFLFVTLMFVIMLNLFVGIAVGEIKTVLDEASIQRISMRISFVLKIQSAVDPFSRRLNCLNNLFNMTFESYTYENDLRLVIWIDKVYQRVLNILYDTEQEIILADPQKRLEEQFSTMSDSTGEQIMSVKYGKS